MSTEVDHPSKPTNAYLLFHFDKQSKSLLDNLKAEEMQLESVLYNTEVKDDIFKP